MRVPAALDTGCEFLTTLSGSATSGSSADRSTVRTAWYFASASGVTGTNGAGLRALIHSTSAASASKVANSADSSADIALSVLRALIDKPVTPEPPYSTFMVACSPCTPAICRKASLAVTASGNLPTSS